MNGQPKTKDGELRRGGQRYSDIVFILVCGMVVGIFAWFADTSAPLETVFSRASGDNYNLLVQGFSTGQLNLKEDAPPELARLTNPYDPILNAPFLGGRIDDLTYYKGKLYLYFGLTPAVVFFWPYYAVTGHFLSEKAAVAFFFGSGFAAIAGVLLGARRRYFPDCAKWIPAAGTLMPGFALALTLPVNVHETVIVCGFGFVMLALAAIWAALHEPKTRVIWLALASLAYGLAIGSRPDLLFGAVVLLLPALYVWRSSVGRTWQRGAVLLTAAVGPLALIGLGLMLYNFERFGNPFEFGFRYQLNTSYQPASAQLFSEHYFWLNFRLYILEPFAWNQRFPFLKTAPLPPLPPGYDPGSVYTGGGILFIYPIFLFVSGFALLWKRGWQGTLTILGWFSTACLLLFITGAVTLCFYLASSSSYELDFLPSLLLLLVIATYCIDRAALPFPGRRRLLWLGWFLLMIYSIAINLMANIETRAESDFFVGNLFLANGRFDEARAQYQKALARSPECADGHRGLGDLDFKQGRLDEAIIEYEKALQMNPDLVEVHNNLGRCFLREGRLDEAVGQLEIAVHMRPGSVNYRNALGAAYAKKGWWNAAITQFEKSVAIEPALPEARDDLGYCLLQIGRVDEAIAENRIAATLEPASAEYLETLANAYCQKGLFDDAVLEYKKASELHPDDAEIFNNLAYCLQQTGRSDEAIIQYRKAVEIQPGFVQAYFNLANVYREKKMASQAKACYEKAIALAPQFMQAQLALVWMLSTWPDSSIRSGSKAVSLAKNLNDLSGGTDPKILRALAAAYAETGKFQEASSTARQALALVRFNPGLTNALQSDIQLYLAHSPVRSTGEF